MVDEMWHTFLLFTEDYHEFCDFHFGFFVDHMPVSEVRKGELHEEWQEKSEVYLRKRESKLKELMGQYLSSSIKEALQQRDSTCVHTL